MSKLKTLRFELKTNLAAVKALRETIKSEVAAEKAAKALAKESKAARLAEKRALAIVKAEARLQRLLEKQAAPVGIKAKKAGRKAGEVKTYNPEEIAEANAIAQAITAKKAKASESAKA